MDRLLEKARSTNPGFFAFWGSSPQHCDPMPVSMLALLTKKTSAQPPVTGYFFYRIEIYIYLYNMWLTTHSNAPCLSSLELYPHLSEAPKSWEKQMSEQNYFADFTSDPIAANLKLIKAKLAAVMIDLIEENGWNQKSAAEALKISQPRVSNLFRGYLNSFSIDFLLEKLAMLGYKVNLDYDPTDSVRPLSMELKKAAL